MPMLLTAFGIFAELFHKLMMANKAGKERIVMQNVNHETRECISCHVKNCVYHSEGNSCTAGKIQVGNSEASCSKETCCDTFSAKETLG